MFILYTNNNYTHKLQCNILKLYPDPNSYKTILYSYKTVLYLILEISIHITLQMYLACYKSYTRSNVNK